MGAVFSGDVKAATKALAAIAYLNRGKSVVEVLHSIEHLTEEQRRRWVRLNVALYKQFTGEADDDDALYFYPDGTPYFCKEEEPIDEEDKPF
jgi:hypothetical protein